MDQLTPPGEEGPSTAVWSMKNYVVSMREIWGRVDRALGRYRDARHLQTDGRERGGIARRDAERRLQDGHGQRFEALRRLENAIFYQTHGTAATSTPTRVHQLDGGIPVRVPDLRGHPAFGHGLRRGGWRNLSGDLTGDGTFNLASGSMGGFRRSYNLLTRGPRTPDVCFMSLKPFEDFESMHETACGNVGSTTMIQFKRA